MEMVPVREDQPIARRQEFRIVVNHNVYSGAGGRKRAISCDLV